MTKTCSWGICLNTEKKNPKLRFVPFVKPSGRFEDKGRAARWVYLCGRKNFTLENITRHSFICAYHFPNYENKGQFNPILNQDLEPYYALSPEDHPKFVPTNGNTVEKKPKIPADLHDIEEPRNFENVKTFKKKSTVTTIEVPYGVKKATATPSKIDAKYDYKSPKTIKFLAKNPMEFVKSVTNEAEDEIEDILEHVELVDDNLGPKPVIPMKKFKSSSTQYNNSDLKNPPVVVLSKHLIRKKAKTPVCDFLLETEARAKLYTGYGEKQRRVWWEFLTDCKGDLEVIGHPKKKKTGELFELSIECQFLLTLEILRRNTSFKEASIKYKIANPDLISQVFKTWLQFFYYELKEYDEEWFTKFKDLPRPLPKCFRNPIMENCRVVIGMLIFFYFY